MSSRQAQLADGWRQGIEMCVCMCVTQSEVDQHDSKLRNALQLQDSYNTKVCRQYVCIPVRRWDNASVFLLAHGNAG